MKKPSRRRRRLLVAVALTAVALVGFGVAWAAARVLLTAEPAALGAEATPGSVEWLDSQRERYIEISTASEPGPRNLALSRCIFDTMFDDNGLLGIQLLMRASEAMHAGATNRPVGTHMIAAPLLDVSLYCAKQVDAAPSS